VIDCASVLVFSVDTLRCFRMLISPATSTSGLSQTSSFISTICALIMFIICITTYISVMDGVGRNEILFGRDTRVAPNKIVLDGGPVPIREREIWGS